MKMISSEKRNRKENESESNDLLGQSATSGYDSTRTNSRISISEIIYCLDITNVLINNS